jgi:PAS domain S-box-containing protein
MEGVIMAKDEMSNTPGERSNIAGRSQSYERPTLVEMIDHLPVLMWVARPDGTIEFVNKFGLNYLGRTLEDVANWSWVEVADPTELERIGESWSRSLETGELHELIMNLRRAKDGVLRPHLGRGHSVRDEKGNILYWVGVHTELL